MSTTWRGASRVETPAEDLLFDIEFDLFGEELINLSARRCGLRSRFPPRQAWANACTRAVDDNIRDTHLQRGLKDYPST